MQFEGKVYKSGKVWLVEVPSLDLMTQGKSRKDAMGMIVDATEGLMDRQGFKASTIADDQGRFFLTGNDSNALVAMMLKRQREKAGISLREAASRLGSSSPNAYAAYEQGERIPTTQKLDELLKVLGPGGVRLRVG